MRFHDAAPTDYASCAGGDRVDPNMFGSATPAGTWIDGQSETSGRSHPLALGLDVRWTDAPEPDLGDVDITFSVIAE